MCMVQWDGQLRSGQVRSAHTAYCVNQNQQNAKYSKKSTNTKKTNDEQPHSTQWETRDMYMTQNQTNTNTQKHTTLAQIPIDLLSCILPFLDTTEYLSARRCSQNWYSASKLLSSSPPIDIDLIVQWCHRPRDTRRINLQEMKMFRWPTLQLDGKEGKSLADVDPHWNSHRWIRALTLRQERMFHRLSEGPRPEDMIVRFPYLNALSIDEFVDPSNSDRLSLMIRLLPQDHLSVLLTVACRLPLGVARFTNLRILFCAEIEPAALQELHQLEYLLITGNGALSAQASIRMLIQDHSLRGLGISEPWYRQPSHVTLSTLLGADGQTPSKLRCLHACSAADSQLLDVLMIMPYVETIACNSWSNVAYLVTKKTDAVVATIYDRLSNLHNLFIQDSSIGQSDAIQLLKKCRSLRYLMVEFYSSDVGDLVGVAAASMAKLEFISLENKVGLCIFHVATIRALSESCTSLRTLETGITHPSIWCDETIILLSRLPFLERWNFVWHRTSGSVSNMYPDGLPQVEFSSTMLAAIGQSKNWRVIHLSIMETGEGWRQDQSDQTKNGEKSVLTIFSQDLDYSTLKHFRFYCHSIPSCKTVGYHISSPNTYGERFWLDENDQPRPMMEETK